MFKYFRCRGPELKYGYLDILTPSQEEKFSIINDIYNFISNFNSR